MTILKRAKRNWDVFISYASEDRTEVAEPLAELLSACGVKVWYDQEELRLGDRLRRALDEGLAHCRYGLVVLSQSFFSKHYTNQELDGLAQREVNGKNVILPIWHNVTDDEVRTYSPTLADRIAVRWEDGLTKVALSIIRIVSPQMSAPNIRIGREAKKSQLVQDLKGSPSFKATRRTLARLAEFESYTNPQRNAIVLAAITNNQIYWIASDSDINRYLRRVVEGYEERIDPDNLAKFELIYKEEADSAGASSKGH